jgi:ATP-dependent Lhr-like helicase
VLLEPQALNIGSVNEDFAVESIAGDIFQLGNASYRILRVEPGKVRVEDAHGQPPTIPFWLGEAPGRSDELSAAVARLQARSTSAGRRRRHGRGTDWLQATFELGEAARAVARLPGPHPRSAGALPSQDTLVMERFSMSPAGPN